MYSMFMPGMTIKGKALISLDTPIDPNFLLSTELVDCHLQYGNHKTVFTHNSISHDQASICCNNLFDKVHFSSERFIISSNMLREQLQVWKHYVWTHKFTLA